MSLDWALILDSPSADPLRIVAGLPLVLRLALDAQQAGASALIVAADASAVRTGLVDGRLRLALLERPEPGMALLRVPANWVVPRAVFQTEAAALNGGGDERTLRSARPPPAARYAFEPLEVTDASSARRAERLLFRSLRKPQDGWTSRYLNRYLSLPVSRLLVRTPLHPNHVSVAILGVGLAGAALATRGTYAALLGGALLFQAQSVLDGCDGEMSRVTHRGSRTGEWLDTIGDDLTNYGFFAGAAYGLYRTTEAAVYLALGAVIVLAGLIASGLEYRYLLRIGSGDLLRYPLSQGQGQGGFLSRLTPLFKRDTFVLLTLLAAACGALGLMLYVFALGAIGILVGVLRTEARLAREARAARAGG